MKYKIGIMSSKWTVEAPTLDIAVATVRTSQKTTAPVVCFNSKEQSRFASFEWYTNAEWQSFLDENADEIRIAYRTMELM